MRIAVAGGQGTIGRLVVQRIEAIGHEAVVLSRRSGVDVLTGDGLDRALVGVTSVIDASNVATQSEQVAVDFFRASAATLQAAEARAGVQHHVVISIVGADLSPAGYMRGKVAQEEAAAAGDIGWTVQRITQFHEFADQMMAAFRFGPVSLVPAMRTQPIAGREAAELLVELALAGPVGRAPDLAGPQEESLIRMARASARRRGGRRLVLGVRLPGAAGRAMRDGSNLPTTPGPRGSLTFDAWLDEQHVGT